MIFWSIDLMIYLLSHHWLVMTCINDLLIYWLACPIDLLMCRSKYSIIIDWWWHLSLIYWPNDIIASSSLVDDDMPHSSIDILIFIMKSLVSMSNVSFRKNVFQVAFVQIFISITNYAKVKHHILLKHAYITFTTHNIIDSSVKTLLQSNNRQYHSNSRCIST